MQNLCGLFQLCIIITHNSFTETLQRHSRNVCTAPYCKLTVSVFPDDKGVYTSAVYLQMLSYIFDEVKPIFSGLLSRFSCYDDYQCVRGGCIFSCCELHGLRELDSLTYVEGFTFCFVPKVSFLPLCFTSESTAEPS